jgi:hypothetical protein
MKVHAHGRACGIAASALAAVALAAALVAPAAVAAPPCHTKNVGTDTEYKGPSSLADAIADASAGDTVRVWGTCHGNFVIAKDLTLQGKGGTPTLDGDQAGRVLRISSGTTTLRDLKITNGKTSSLGGGIYVGTAAVLDHVLVTGNAAGLNSFGGGIEADFHSRLTLVDSDVSGNTAGSSGGIDMFMATASITDSTVSGNEATGATTDGCLFDVIRTCAGGIWNYHGTLALTDSNVTGNSAGYRGGGMRNDATFAGGVPTDGVTILAGSAAITSNTAGDQGGGIWASGRVANSTPPPATLPFDPNGSVQAADGTTAEDPISGDTLPQWTGSISGNSPDQCFPALTIGTFSCS